MIQLDEGERRLLLDGIFMRYGYDFRQYAEASLDRRIGAVLQRFNIASPLELLNQLYHNREFFAQVLPHLTINTTEAFRDPGCFKTLREKVVPVLHTYPTLRIWVAGCSTGEEVYSLAILLKEEGLLERTTIYATDINPRVLSVAKDGIYAIDTAQTLTKNYASAGGKQSPSEYYTAEYGLIRFDPDLRRNIVFAQHNLVTDGVFVEAHLILCRNVLIYFGRELQDRVVGLFHSSLVYRGFLSIGTKESLRFSAVGEKFAPVELDCRIYRKEFEASEYRSRGTS